MSSVSPRPGRAPARPDEPRRAPPERNRDRPSTDEEWRARIEKALQDFFSRQRAGGRARRGSR